MPTRKPVSGFSFSRHRSTSSGRAFKYGVSAGMFSTDVRNSPGKLSRGTCKSNFGSGFPRATSAIHRQLVKQRNECRLTLQNDRFDPVLEQRNIADELDRIAQSLLGMNEQRLALRGLAVPQGLPK